MTRKDSATTSVALPASAGAAPWDKRAWIELALVVLVALVVRLVYVAWVRGEFWFNFPLADSKNYHDWALGIVSGNILGNSVWKHSPLYAFWMAGIYALTNARVPAVVEGVQLLLLAPFAGALLYLLGRRLENGAVGLGAGLLQAVYVPGIFLDGNLLSPLLIQVLNLSVLLTAWAARRRGRWWFWTVPGVLLGLSVTTRPNSALLFPVLVIWLWLQNSAPETRRKMLGSVLGLGLGLVVVLVPVAVRNQIVLQETIFTVPSAGLNFYLGNHSTATGYLVPKDGLGISSADMLVSGKALAEQRLGHGVTFSGSSQYWANLAWKEIEADPWRWMKLLAVKALRLVNDYEYTTSLNYNYVRAEVAFFRFPWLSFGVAFALALAGMWTVRKRWRDWFLVYGLAGAYAFSNIFILISTEYRFGLMPAIFLFAGAAITELLAAIRGRQWQAVKLPVVFFLVGLGLGYAPALPPALKQFHLGMAYKKMGLGWAESGDTSHAIAALETSLRIFRDRKEFWADLQFQLGAVHLRAGHVDEALNLLSEAHAQSPQVEAIANALASAWNQKGDHRRALVLCREAVAREPGNADFWINLGSTLLWLGQDAESRQAFDQAFDLRPNAELIQRTQEEILSQRALPPRP